MVRTSPLGEVWIELSEVDSTNNYAIARINEGLAEHGLVVRADYQTQGRGQQGNTWLSQESRNLLFSVVLDMRNQELSSQFILNMAACLGVLRYLESALPASSLSIKWPNDIYAGNQKLSGILIENLIRGNQWNHAIAGIGLNVNQKSFPGSFPATSMTLQSGKNYRVKQVLKELLHCLGESIQLFASDPKKVMEAYNTHLMNMGQELVFRKQSEWYKGVVEGVNENGQLCMLVEGSRKRYNHRDIEWIV